MIIASNFLSALAKVLSLLLESYLWIVVAAAVVTWVNAAPWNPIVRFLRGMTEPVYRRLHRWLPFLVAGGLDFSPLILIAIIYFLQVFLVGTLEGWASQLLVSL